MAGMTNGRDRRAIGVLGILALAIACSISGPPSQFRDQAPAWARVVGHYWLALYAGAVLVAVGGVLCLLFRARTARVLASVAAALLTLGNVNSALIGAGSETRAAAGGAVFTAVCLVLTWWPRVDGNSA